MSRNTDRITRVNRTKAEAKVTYDRMSRWYDLIAGPFERRYTEMGLQMLGVRDGERVLEIGFGTGHALVTLAQDVGATGQVYGIDISEGMCQVSWSRIQASGLAGWVKLKCGDAATLPFKTMFFDAVFMSFTLELFDTPEIPVVLSECKRVLRDGGRIGVVAMSRKGKASIIRWLYEWLHERFPALIDCRPIYVEQSLADADFTIVERKDISIMGLRGEIVLAVKTS